MNPENQEQKPTSESESSKGASSTGMEENLAGLLCYALSWLTGIIFLAIEKDSKFVKFHAMQSIVTFGGLTVIGWVLGIIAGGMFTTSLVTGGVAASFGMASIIGLLGTIIWILTFVLWILLMVKAYQGEKFKLPIVGNIAEKFSNK